MANRYIAPFKSEETGTGIKKENEAVKCWWKEGEILDLIAIAKDMEVLIQLDGKRRRSADVYNDIASEMKSRGHDKT